MNTIKTKSDKYPRRVTFNNGRSSPVPNQKKFKNDFIRNHGCSLAAFYIALRFSGKKEKMNALLKWSRSHLKGHMKAKLTIKGVAKGLNKKAGRKVTTYHRIANLSKINKALDSGHLVLLETGDPIHTNVLYRSKPKHTYHLDHGNVKKINTAKMVKRATKSATYRGWVDVRG